MKKVRNHTTEGSVDFNPHRKGIPKAHRDDVYYHLLGLSWPRLIALLFVMYFLCNLVFAAFYYLIPGSIANNHGNSFMNAFYFSVQTLSTLGYGVLSPNGLYGNLLVTFEAAFGLISIASVTGLVFAKLSRPYAKILYSKNIIRAKFNGKDCLSIRLGNARGKEVIEAKAHVSILINTITHEGEHLRRIEELILQRKQTPFFALSWSLFHEIDENSPIYKMDLKSGVLKAIIVTVTGHDITYSNKIYSRYNYSPDEIIEDRYFADIMTTQEDGKLVIDYDKFHDLK